MEKDREDQRIKLTKRLLAESLVELLKEKPLEKVTVTELCRKAGINRATFYNHYDMPADVLRVIDEDFSRHVLDELKSANCSTALEMMEVFCQTIYDNRAKISVILNNNGAEAATLLSLKETINSEEAYLNKLKEVCRQDEATVEMVRTFLANGALALIKKWIVEDVDMEPKAVAQLMYYLCFIFYAEDSKNTLP